MKLKLDADGKPVFKDGLPVFVNDDGSELAIDVKALHASVARLNSEAKTHRERAEAAEGNLAKFVGIEDVEAAKKALNIVKNLDDKKLVDAGKVDEIKNALNKEWEAKLKEATEAREKLNAQLIEEKIGGAFARSTYIGEKLAVPADMVRATFGSHFAIEDNKIVAKGRDGNRVFSRANPGEHADFEEALGILVEAYPHRDSILKSAMKPGAGGSGGGGQGGGAKSISRKEFSALPPDGQMAHMKSGGSVTD